MPSLSVVIPTHQRSEILRLALKRLQEQTVADDLEVIVVSDGHDDKTSSLMAKETWRIPVTFLEIEKSHQGVARNRGVERASSPFVLFIGDDILLERDACEKHLAAHHALRSESVAVLGYTTWDLVLGVSPVMKWLEQSGWQFGYPKIRKYARSFVPADIQDRFTYTSHVSVPLSVARRFPFLREVSLYGWEDVEWGKRLKEAGVRLYFEPDSRALHHHALTLEDSLERMKTLGESAARLEQLVPSLSLTPKGRKLLAYRVLSLAPTMRGRHAKAFLAGLNAQIRSETAKT